MTGDDLEAYLRSIGLIVSRRADAAGTTFTVAHGVVIPRGGLRGRSCDVAIQYVDTQPYVTPSAIHTRPALVAMDMTEPVKTQASSLGADWQYWSRRYDRLVSPRGIWGHVLTVLSDPRWVAT